MRSDFPTPNARYPIADGPAAIPVGARTTEGPGGIAHDLNNMLIVILGHAEMALLDQSLSLPQREHLLAIQTAGRRSALLTRQLLTLPFVATAAPQQSDLHQAHGEVD